MTIKPDLTGYNYGAISTLVLKDRLISSVPANTDLTISGKLGKFDLTRYNYGSISSLVLTADRSELSRRDKEPNSAPTSLSSRIDSKEMAQLVTPSNYNAEDNIEDSLERKEIEIDEDAVAVVFDEEGFEI